MKDFNGKTVYITGGSAGIGLAAAKLFASKGSDVMIFARREEVLRHAVAEISSCRLRETQKTAWLSLDVSDYQEVKLKISQAVQTFGTPDVLINCAGRAYPHYFESITFEQFDETMKINLYGIWNIVSTLVPHMKEKGGYIVNVSSLAGLVGVFGYTDYCASKFGIIGFSEALRCEMRRYGIHVSVLCPPDTDTPGFEVENRSKPDETRAISASASLMSPERVAKALLKGMKRHRFIIMPGLDGKFTYFMKRLFPWVVTLVMNRAVNRAQSLK